MKAVNLLPREARRSGGSGALSGLGIGTTAVFAALGLALALTVAYVILANGVTTRKDELAKLNRQSTAAQRDAVALKPYADLEQLRESLLDRVRTLAGGRFDWPTALSRIARALPKDTTLTNFTGNPGAASAAATPAATTPADASATPAPASGPTVNLEGCTPSHIAVARVIDRLRAVSGVDSVSLQSSTVAAASTGSAAPTGGCPGAEQFKLTVQLSAPAIPAAPAAAAQAPAAGAPTPTPTPSPAPASPQASTGAAPGGTS
jgi:Tfp pilus assembly protein PilN